MQTAAPSAAAPDARPTQHRDPFVLLRRPGARRLTALIGPVLVGAALTPGRESTAAAVTVLIYTLFVVAVAATGDRVAGLIASISSAAWMDFFLIPPYLTFRIARGEDVLLAILFAGIGLAVTELALRGRRQAAEVARRGGYVDGVLGVVRIDPAQGSGLDRREAICQEITRVLGIDSCSYVDGPPPDDWPVLDDTGQVSLDGRRLDVAGSGLPTTSVTAIPVRRAGSVLGHFRLVAATRVVRPDGDQLKVAVLLADQAAHD